jgi:DNA polymerase III delta prime subunit
MADSSSIPWIEKYRPDRFDNIVLDPANRIFFKNILSKKYFPHLLFYGPPGTGKTTTILNLISEFQNPRSNSDIDNSLTSKNHLLAPVPRLGVFAVSSASAANKHKENVIHLNASDERGIDIIRNQIHQFVKSNHLFEPGLKFVVLDEVDYMTKNAQQALKTLLQTCRANVRFCLICNYISKIDESLRNEFVCVRFNQLPKTEIYRFIQHIADKEQLHITSSEIETIQTNYNSDIRSMINFIQLHSNIDNTPPSDSETDPNTIKKSFNSNNTKLQIIRNEEWETIHRLILPKHTLTKKEISTLPSDTVEIYIHKLSIRYNIDKRNILNSYFNYVIRHFPEVISEDFLSIIQNATFDTENIPIKHVLQYLCAYLTEYYANIM